MVIQSKLNTYKAILIIFMVAHTVMCYLGCIQVTTRWYAGVDLHASDEISYRQLCAPFVTLMTLIRIVLLYRNNAKLHKYGCLLSVVVAIITSTWVPFLGLQKSIYAGLTSTTMELSAIGQASIVLAWCIVVAQVGLSHWIKKVTVRTEHTEKNLRRIAIQVVIVILLILVLVIFRNPLLDLLRNI